MKKAARSQEQFEEELQIPKQHLQTHMVLLKFHIRLHVKGL